MSENTPRAVPELVAREIRKLIEEEGYAAGDLLPSQRELAERLGVSRASLREALSSLSALGLVSVHPGKGAYVREPSGEGSATGFEWPFAEAVSAADIFQLRHALEGFAAGLAARVVTDAEIALLEHNVQAMRHCLQAGDFEGAAQLDFEFHRQLLQASGNAAMLKVIASNAAIFLESQKLPFIRPERALETWREHKRILRALARQSPAAARRAMQEHIRAAASRTGIAFAVLDE